MSAGMTAIDGLAASSEGELGPPRVLDSRGRTKRGEGRHEKLGSYGKPRPPC